VDGEFEVLEFKLVLSKLEFLSLDSIQVSVFNNALVCGPTEPTGLSLYLI
jgi:hypothetical protein